MRAASLVSLAGAASVQAALQGFNYGSTLTTSAAKSQSDFEAEFSRAQSLQGTSGFNAARLYTMIQADTANTPISAIPAAISTNTKLLLGMWASAGQASFSNEIAALKSAIDTYGTKFTSLVVGLSIGSEDLYRVSPTGIENNSGLGASPQELTSYISQVKSAIAGTPAAQFSLGHVDTWTAWVNGSNSAVIDALDWLGVDSYPYFENTVDNSMENQANLFFQSYNATVGVAGGRDVWITETGFPVSGKTENLAVPSVQNAELYWQQVACSVLGKINTFWYTIQDAEPDVPNPSFGIIGPDLNSAPLYNLTCKAITATPSSSSSASSSSASSTSTGKASSHSAGSSTTTGKAHGSSSTATASSSGSGSSASGSSSSSGSSSGSGSSPSSSSGSGSQPSGTSEPSGSTSGSGSGSSTSTSTSSSPSSSATIVPSNDATSLSGSLSTIAAAFAALFMVVRM